MENEQHEQTFVLGGRRLWLRLPRSGLLLLLQCLRRLLLLLQCLRRLLLLLQCLRRLLSLLQCLRRLLLLLQCLRRLLRRRLIRCVRLRHKCLSRVLCLRLVRHHHDQRLLLPLSTRALICRKFIISNYDQHDIKHLSIPVPRTSRRCAEDDEEELEELEEEEEEEEADAAAVGLARAPKFLPVRSCPPIVHRRDHNEQGSEKQNRGATSIAC